MAELHLVKKTLMPSGQYKYSCSTSCSMYDCTKALFHLKSFSVGNISLTMVGGTMEPNITVHISDFREMEEYCRRAHVLYCIFSGKTNRKDVIIHVRFDLNRIIIVSDEASAESIIKEMNLSC